MNSRISWLLTFAGAIVAFSAGAPAQQYTNASGTNLPSLGSATEAVKFGDWDLDGDLDIVYANGGDAGPQQSRLLINQGLAQAGTLGIYLDKTAAQLGIGFGMSSRDVQPVDIDNDGDLDFYFSNHSDSGNQSNLWSINQGGKQGGVAGKFQIDMLRWVGLGAAGANIYTSSIAPGLKIATGNFKDGFVDWSCQCDFADVDLDGDMDLMHTSYGTSFSGEIMSRMFLNDSLGFFSEYNPSGQVSGSPNLNPNSAAGFVEGVQVVNTLNTTGTQHDITNVALDADFADFDGDFDNDLQIDSRNTQQRMYQNRWFENGESLGLESAGTRLYRDVTGSWLLGPGGQAEAPGANYDNDFNDMDNDSDVDGYFLGYIGTTDNWAVNNGIGNFTGFTTVPSSGNDDNEIDWHDFDHDGDVDPFVSGFGSPDRFYKNQFIETGNINLTLAAGIATGVGTNSLGADMGDMDNDHDIDIISATDGGGNEVLLRNNLNTPDPIAPRVSQTRQVVGGPTLSTPDAVLARVFDNLNFEYFHSATGTVNYTVDGVPKPARTATYAGGNIFRGTIPGYWHGSISYTVKVADRKGNIGTSTAKVYVNSLTGFSTYGTETPGCSGTQTIGVNSGPTINNPDFALTCTGSPAASPQLCVVTNSIGTGGDPFGISIALWVDFFAATEVYGLNSIVSGGVGTASAPIPNVPALAGTVYYAQFIHADVACGQLVAASRGAQLTIQP